MIGAQAQAVEVALNRRALQAAHGAHHLAGATAACAAPETAAAAHKALGQARVEAAVSRAGEHRSGHRRGRVHRARVVAGPQGAQGFQGGGGGQVAEALGVDLPGSVEIEIQGFEIGGVDAHGFEFFHLYALVGRHRSGGSGGQALGLSGPALDLAGQHRLAFGLHLHLLDRAPGGFPGGFAQGPGLLGSETAGRGQGGGAGPPGAHRAWTRGRGLGVGSGQFDGPGGGHELHRDDPLDEFGWGEQSSQEQAHQEGGMEPRRNQRRLSSGPGIRGFGKPKMRQRASGRVIGRCRKPAGEGQGGPPGAGAPGRYNERPCQGETLRCSRAPGGGNRVRLETKLAKGPSPCRRANATPGRVG